MTAGPWLITSPYGLQMTTSWGCFHCRGNGHAQPGLKIRAEAAAHVESAGHQVIVYYGTAELLLPLATTTPAPKELTP